MQQQRQSEDTEDAAAARRTTPPCRDSLGHSLAPRVAPPQYDARDGGGFSDGRGSSPHLTIGRRQGWKAATTDGGGRGGGFKPSIFDIFSAGGKHGGQAAGVTLAAGGDASSRPPSTHRPLMPPAGSLLVSPRVATERKPLAQPSAFGMGRRKSTAHQSFDAGGDDDEAFISLVSDDGDQEEGVSGALGEREHREHHPRWVESSEKDADGEVSREPVGDKDGGGDFLSISHMARYGQVASASMNRVVRNHNALLQGFAFNPQVSKVSVGPTAASASPRRLGGQHHLHGAGGGPHSERHDGRDVPAGPQQSFPAGTGATRKKAFKTFSRRGR